MAQRLFWPCWGLAAVTTGLVAGFMLGHALILGRFLDWMLAADPRQLAATYPVFRASAGARGLGMFYAICGLQVVACVALLAVALAARCHRVGAGVAALAGILWLAVHYGSGFGAVEVAVLRSTTPAAPEVAARFQSLNLPVHFAHVAVLLVGLVVLLVMPFGARDHGQAPSARGR